MKNRMTPAECPAVDPQVLALIEQLVPRIVSATLAALALAPDNRPQARPRPGADVSPDSKRVLRGASAQGAAVGVSRWTIQAMRRAARSEAEYATRAGEKPPISPFRGQLAAPHDILDWLRRHPDFSASRQYRRFSVEAGGGA
jgi:hypothetical protein